MLAVTAVADTFANARARAYRAVDQIDFADGFHRRDIGWRELAREERMNALWTYFWPCFAAGLIVGGSSPARSPSGAARSAIGALATRRRRRACARALCGTGRSAAPTASRARVERGIRPDAHLLRDDRRSAGTCITAR